MAERRRAMKRGPLRHMERGEFIALLLALLILAMWYSVQVNAVTSERESCARGNNIRTVLLNNSTTAVEHSIAHGDDPELTEGFQESIDILLSGPGVGEDGLVDCEEQIEMPIPLNLFGL